MAKYNAVPGGFPLNNVAQNNTVKSCTWANVWFFFKRIRIAVQCGYLVGQILFISTVSVCPY